MNKRKLFAGMASVAMAATLVGCSGSNGSAADTFTVGINQELAGVFSPLYYQTAYDGDVINLVYQSLLKYNTDSELVPELAKEMPEVSEDGMTVTFHLKEGVKFSDGTDLTSSDVKYTFTVLADPSYTGRMSNYVEDLVGYEEYSKGDAEELTGIECPDDYTVVFHLANPRIDAVSTFGGMGICSDEQFEYTKGNTEEIEQNTDKPIGSGAYVLNNYDKATGASLTRNENFKAEEGQYTVKNVIIKKTDASTEFDELKNGTIDLLPTVIDANFIGQASLDENLTFNHYPRAGVGYVAFNCAQGATADQAVRQALAYATDREGFNASYYAYEEASDELKDIPVGYQPQAYWNPASKNMGAYVRGVETVEGLTDYSYDMEKAKATLDAAGWVVGADGIREKDGQKLEVKFVATKDNSVLDTLIPMIKKSYKELGVDLKTTEVDFNTLIAMIGDDSQLGDWNAFFMATGYTGCEDTDSLANYGYTVKDGVKTPNVDNYPRLVDDQLNDLLNAAYRTGNTEESVKNYLAAMERATDLMSYLPIYGNEYFDLYNKRVEGLETAPVHTWSQSMDTVTLAK